MHWVPPTGHVPEAPPLPYEERRPKARPSTKQRTLGGKIGESIAVLLILALAGLIWYAGAYFTLAALRAVGLPIAPLGWGQWAIPAGMSVLELRYWPRRGMDSLKGVLFAAISGLDLLSTVYGLIQWAPGQLIPLGAGYQLPTDKQALMVPAIVTSVLFTFIPERAFLWGLAELRTIWEV